jgi:large subunit ribosomal protein L17
MRHGKKFNHLGRKAGHRKALLKNMANSLIEHKRINTTIAKARALRKYVEPLITKAKSDSTHSRRVVFSYLQNKDSIKELFGPIAVKVGDRPGGYIRIIKTGFRMSDGAEMAMIELVDFNETMLAATKDGGASKGKKRRTRRGSKKNVEAAAAVATPPAVAEDAIAASEEEE